MGQTTIDINDERINKLIDRFVQSLMRNIENCNNNENDSGNALRNLTRADIEAIAGAVADRENRGRRRCDDDDDEGVLGDFYDDECRPTCRHGSRHDRRCCRRSREREETLERLVLGLVMESNNGRRCGCQGSNVLGATTGLSPEMVDQMLEIADRQRNGSCGCLDSANRRCRRDGDVAGIQDMRPSCGCGR